MDNDLVTFVVESKNYQFSRKKLSECSGYFNIMFNSDFAEKNKSVIKLEEVSVKSWEHILFYITNGKIRQCSREELVEEMLPLLQAANMFQFIDIQEKCSKLLYNVLDVSNAIRILEIASQLDSTNLIHKARAIALWNFDDVSKQDVFFNLSSEQVEGYISDPALHSWTGEWGVWEAIDRWLNLSDKVSESRTKFLPRLIKCLHLDSLSLFDLKCMAWYDSVQHCPVVNESIRRVIKERTSKGEIKEENSESKESDEVTKFIEDWQKTERRKLPFVPSVVGNILTGPENLSPSIIKFCETEGKFVPVLTLNKVQNSLGSMVGFKVIADGSKLFLLGGNMLTREGAWNHAVWMYDQIQKTWIFLSNLLRPSRHMSACCLGNHLYVIGGFGRHRLVQDTVCKLDLKDKIWTICARLPRPLYSVLCCVFRNHIYVIESMIYQYIPSRDVWITLDVSLSAKGFANAMANDDFIFLSEAYTRNIYRFDPSNPTEGIKLLGQFEYECTQACLIDEHIFSLSQDAFGKEIYCEKLNIHTGESTVLCKTVDGRIADVSPKHRHGCFPLLLY